MYIFGINVHTEQSDIRNKSRYISLTTHNIIADDLYMTITIRSCMLVPKSNDVTQFVYNYTEFVTVFSNANSLRSVTSLSNERATSIGENRFDKLSNTRYTSRTPILCFLYFLFREIVRLLRILRHWNRYSYITMLHIAIIILRERVAREMKKRMMLSLKIILI